MYVGLCWMCEMNGCVEFVVGQEEWFYLFGDVYGDGWMLILKVFQLGDQLVGCEGWNCGDIEICVFYGLVYQIQVVLFQLIENFVYLYCVLCVVGCQLYVVVDVFEQCYVQKCFQLVDLVIDGVFGVGQFVGGVGEIVVLGCCFEGQECGIVWNFVLYWD